MVFTIRCIHSACRHRCVWSRPHRQLPIEPVRPPLPISSAFTKRAALCRRPHDKGGQWQQRGVPCGWRLMTPWRFCGVCFNAGGARYVRLPHGFCPHRADPTQQRVDDLFDNVLHARKGGTVRGGARPGGTQQRLTSSVFGGRKI